MTISAESIARRLGGRKSGSGWSCKCPAHDDNSPSLLVRDGDKGPLFKCFAGCASADVAAALRNKGLLGDGARDYIPPHRRQVEDDAAARSDFARRIWLESRPPERSPVEAYLRNRGIMGEIPKTLRYHPSLKHRATGLHLPALVAAITRWPESQVVAIHRIYLTMDGRKAPVSPDKAMLGPVGGAAVRMAPVGPVLASALPHDAPSLAASKIRPKTSRLRIIGLAKRS